MAREGRGPWSPRGQGRERALTSGQAWEGTEAIQVLGYLLPQVFKGAEIRGQGEDQGAGLGYLRV